MTTPADYVLSLKTRLTTSPSVDTFTVVEEKIWPERGYIRIRVTLSHGDFLEMAEYFVVEEGEHKTLRYRWANEAIPRCLRGTRLRAKQFGPRINPSFVCLELG